MCIDELEDWRKEQAQMTNEKPTNPSHGELLDAYADSVQPCRSVVQGKPSTDELRSLILGKMGEGAEAYRLLGESYLREQAARTQLAELQARLAAQPDVRDLAREIVQRIYEVPCSTPTPIVEGILAAHLAPQAGVPSDPKTYDPIAELEYIAKEITGEDVALEDLSGQLDFAIQVLKERASPEVVGAQLERAAQKMAEAYGWGWEHMGDEAKATFRKMAKAALEVLQPDPWVDVKVGLPKDEVAKLVFVQETLCSFTAYFDGCDWLSFEPNGRSTVIWGVTHWREIQNDIPAPPETRATEGK